ncbi:hypothetical protein PFICI_14569 [Pestalotiopsis fici W106-1]|uniref:Uncharacterized protein n=1 Tax=Pestalotiopsis fici (strain W106-1 / CGMCC3.15140) TaxID=1229662 RepID=W3WIB2_PESFW|nr:uncharacterized protein PFICI_14569 [Pestalotiopsis fici W106-1]ETS73623.1 hypothetical protein PFICI_14569 [Pestalotiopsis fici W106-1]
MPKPEKSDKSHRRDRPKEQKPEVPNFLGQLQMFIQDTQTMEETYGPRPKTKQRDSHRDAHRESRHRESHRREPHHREPHHREPHHREPHHREPHHRESHREPRRHSTGLSSESRKDHPGLGFLSAMPNSQLVREYGLSEPRQSRSTTQDASNHRYHNSKSSGERESVGHSHGHGSSQPPINKKVYGW